MKPHTILSYLAFIFLSFLPTTSFAYDDDAVKKYKNYTPEQIRDLSDDERQSLPLEYAVAAKRGLAADAKLAIAKDLNTLMYPGIANYEVAIKSFQTDMGDKPTGTLTVWQIDRLQVRAEIQKLGTIDFPENFSSFITNDSAQIKGTVTSPDKEIAQTINQVMINCYKKDKYCEYKQIVLGVPNGEHFMTSYQIFDLGPEIYKITRWEGNSIDAVGTFNELCRTISLNYNFKTKEFFATTRNTGKKCDLLGVAIPKLPKPIISQIVDGKKIIEAEYSKIQERAYSYLASDFRKQMDDLTKKQKKDTK